MEAATYIFFRSVTYIQVKQITKGEKNVEQGLDSIHRVLIEEVWGLNWKWSSQSSLHYLVKWFPFWSKKIYNKHD